MDFRTFLEENEKKQSKEIIKTKIGSKKTVVIHLTADEFQKLSGDFEKQDNGRTTFYVSKKRYHATSLGAWTVGFVKVTDNKYSSYGTSGDYWFGNAPGFYSNDLGGNIKPGTDILKQLIDEYDL